MEIKRKFLLRALLYAFVVLFIVLPAGYIYPDCIYISDNNPNLISQEGSDFEQFDTYGLIPYDECPYDLIFNVNDNFTRVEVQFYGEDGTTWKICGWNATLRVNDNLVLEWQSWDGQKGGYYYDYTSSTYFYESDYAGGYTDVTDYIYSGENKITLDHYGEGAGVGVTVKVYYGAEEMYGEETYTSETYAEETTYTETTPPLDTTTVTETYAEEQVTEYTGEEVTPGSEEKDPQKLFLNFKTRYMNPDNPFDVLSMQVPGITEENQRKYEKTIYGYLFGPADYVTPADSWEEVARLSVIESKVHYSYSQNLGYFNTLYYMLSFLYTTVSFKESISELPKQFNILKNVKSAADLVKNSETIFRFTSNLAEIYGTLRDVDSQKADEFGFPEVDKKVMFVIGAVSSGGWSVLADISNEIFASTAQNSINYEIEKAALSSAMAFHCQRLHEIALRRDKITAEEIKEFFFHVRRFIDLKKLDNSLNIRDSMYIWQDNPDLVTSLLDFIDVIDARAAMEEDINMYNGLISNYKQAENLLRTDMSNLGVIWEK